jgi:Cu-Zn family superoxide dismutase
MRFIGVCLVSVCMSGVAFAQGAAKAELKAADGKVMGQAMLRETPNGVLVSVELTGVPPGVHAFHIHAVGMCEGPQFLSAGGHFAPGGTQHGLLARMPAHAGDLPNVHVPADGRVSFEVLAPVTLAAGERSVFDADGAAVMLHAGPDDYTTDPAGNAGGRIACGVITR